MREVLDELRAALGRNRIDFAELAVLGARTKLRELRQESPEAAAARARLLQELDDGGIEIDVAAADEVKRLGLIVDDEP